MYFLQSTKLVLLKKQKPILHPAEFYTRNLWTCDTKEDSKYSQHLQQVLIDYLVPHSTWIDLENIRGNIPAPLVKYIFLRWYDDKEVETWIATCHILLLQDSVISPSMQPNCNFSVLVYRTANMSIISMCMPSHKWIELGASSSIKAAPI